MSYPNLLFPLSVAASGRFLQDATGKPFLYHADTAWRLVNQLADASDRQHYWQHRKALGFNAVHLHAMNREKEGPRGCVGQPAV